MKDFVLQGVCDTPQSVQKYRDELNEEQYEVVTTGDGPHLVLAGAGSGKTRVITYRVLWLLEHGVRPEEMLLLTFTNKAAKEMISRVESALGCYPTGLWAGTFHSIAARMLRMYGDVTPYGKDFSIIDEEDAADLIKLCVKEEHVSDFGKRFPSATVIKAIGGFAQNAQLSVKEVIATRFAAQEPFASTIVRILDRYRAQKVAQRAMDFDDLLSELYTLLKENDGVRISLANRFRYMMVDEFQDTNRMQADIVALLASVHNNVLAVGDDAQSIYSFRAAEIENILAFTKRYPQATVHRLVVNYRSTPQILALANAVIAHNVHQCEKELVAVVRDGEKPCVVPASDDRQEAQYVAEQILALMNDGVPLRNIAVLFRAAFHAQALEFELMRRAIPYEYRGGMKFFERAHVKDALAHLRVFRNVHDGVAWLRVVQIHPGLGLATAAKIANEVSTCTSLTDVFAHPLRLAQKAERGWQGVQTILRAMAQESLPAAMLRAFVASDAYRDYLDAEYQNARERKEDLEQFAIFAEQYIDLGDFLDAVTLTGDFGGLMDTQQERRDTRYEEEKMVLSTIHQAKGLEWDVVFVINLAEGAFPSDKSFAREKDLEEERRLFYVAATRAKKRLFLSYGITAGYEHVVLRQPSTFLDEIPASCKEEIRLRSQAPAWQSWQGRVSQKPRSSASAWQSDEPVIVLNDTGDVVKTQKPMPKSFLTDV